MRVCRRWVLGGHGVGAGWVRGGCWVCKKWVLGVQVGAVWARGGCWVCKKRVLGVCRWVPCVCKKWVLCGHGVGAAGERWVLGVREAGAVPVQVGAVSVQEVGAAGEQRARWDQGRIPGGLHWGLPLSTPKGPPSPCPSLRPLPQGPWAPAAVLRGETTTAGTGGGGAER